MVFYDFSCFSSVSLNRIFWCHNPDGSWTWTRRILLTWSTIIIAESLWKCLIIWVDITQIERCRRRIFQKHVEFVSNLTTLSFTHALEHPCNHFNANTLHFLPVKMKILVRQSKADYILQHIIIMLMTRRKHKFCQKLPLSYNLKCTLKTQSFNKIIEKSVCRMEDGTLLAQTLILL